MEENPGVNPNSIIEFPDPSTGKKVQQRFAKFLEKSLLTRYDKAHGGGERQSTLLYVMLIVFGVQGSEWYMIRPTAPLTFQQLGQNLNTLLTDFAKTDLEHHYDTFIKQFETLMKNTHSG